MEFLQNIIERGASKIGSRVKQLDEYFGIH